MLLIFGWRDLLCVAAIVVATVLFAVLQSYTYRGESKQILQRLCLLLLKLHRSRSRNLSPLHRLGLSSAARGETVRSLRLFRTGVDARVPDAVQRVAVRR